MKIAQKIRNYYQNMITFTQKGLSSLKKYNFSKNCNLRALFSNCRESLVRFFFKKTPLSVRRPGGGGGGLRGERKGSIETLLFYDGFPKIGLWKIWLPKPAPKVGGFGEEENQPPKQAVRPKYTPMLSQAGKILEERSSNLADAHSLKERAEVDVEEKIQSNRRRQRTVHNQGSEILGILHICHFFYTTTI